MAVNTEEKVKRLVEKAFNGSLDNHTVEILNATKVGENYMGSVHNIKIKRNDKKDDDIKFHLFAKMAPHEGCHRNTSPIRAMYECEIHSYENIFPELIKFQKDKNVATFQAFAKSYTSSLEMGAEALLMDDMKIKNFKLIDHRAKLDLPHATLIMREIGKFHALSFAIRDQRPEFFKYLENNCRDIFYSSDKLSSTLHKAVTNIGTEILKSYDTSTHAKEVESLQNFIKNIPSVVNSMLSLDKAGKYAVINHGDLEIRNILFKYNDPAEPHIPTELCLLDWQLTRLGSPALDILFFIFICTEKELRDNHYNRLIEEYYESLAIFLRQLGSDPQILFPYEILLEHLKKLAPFGLYNAIWIVSLNTREICDIPDLSNIKNEDLYVQFLSVVPKRGYVERVRDIISDLIKYDYEF